MRSPVSKVLFDVGGIASIEHVLRAAQAIEPSHVLVVVGADGEPIRRKLAPPARAVVQDPPKGTGHAVQVAMKELADFRGDVVVLYGDGPLIRPESLRALLDHHRRSGAAQTLLVAELEDPSGFGRIVRGADGSVERIVEEVEADASARAIREINTGVIALRAEEGREALAALRNANRKGEYYLTDLVEILRAKGKAVERFPLADPREFMAFNSIEELAAVRAELRARINGEHMNRGVDIVDPATTYIDVDVEIGAGTRILPCTVIGHGVKVGAGCVVGPFAHLRGDTRLEDGAEIGNFVEVKKSAIGRGSKAKHLTYLGDATLGEGVNVGCGTITANYDGKKKHATRIGDRAFIGSGTVLIAPADIGAGATTGAGAVVRRDTRIGAGEVYVGVPARKVERRGAAGGEG